MLFFEDATRRITSSVTNTLVFLLLGFVAAVLSAQLLVGKTPASDLTAVITLYSGRAAASTIAIDLACTSSIFAILGTLYLAVLVLLTKAFQKAVRIFEACVVAVLAVRLAADFVPILLEPMSFDGVAHTFLGYPLVPFWSTAGPLAFLGAALPHHEPVVAKPITAFIAAFATAKGLRVLRDYWLGNFSLELAGGDEVSAEPVNGAVQLALFVLGLWLQCRPPREATAMRRKCCGWDWCGCCGDEPVPAGSVGWKTRRDMI